MFPSRACRSAGPLALALALLGAAVGAAADEITDESTRWVPSLALGFDTLTQKASGRITTGDVMGPPLPQGCNGQGGNLCQFSPRALRPDSSGSDTDVAPLVTASIELMTPRLFERALKPRLFAHADVSSTFGFDRNLAGEAAPSRFAAPRFFQNRQDIDEAEVIGQGTRAEAKLGRWLVSGGGGVAFSFDLFGRRLRLKPSFEYLRQRIELTGRLHRAVKLRQQVQNVRNLDDFRLLVLRTSTSQIQHGIGPGLELEVDTLRAGPFLLSAYAAGRGYYLLGDLDETLTATNEFGESATFHFDRERWMWRGGVGIRFRLLPE